MSRSAKKGIYVDEKLLMKVQRAARTKDRRPIRTWSRRSMITEDFVGVTLGVHTGRTFQNVFVTENMVGHRVGEFAPTRTFRKHAGQEKKGKK